MLSATLRAHWRHVSAVVWITVPTTLIVMWAASVSRPAAIVLSLVGTTVAFGVATMSAIMRLEWRSVSGSATVRRYLRVAPLQLAAAAMAALPVAGWGLVLWLEPSISSTTGGALVGAAIYTASRVVLAPVVAMAEGVAPHRALARAWSLSASSTRRTVGVVLLWVASGQLASGFSVQDLNASLWVACLAETLVLPLVATALVGILADGGGRAAVAAALREELTALTEDIDRSEVTE